MSSTKSLFTSLSQLSDIRSMAITDDRSCPVSSEGVVQVSSQLSLANVLSLLICYQLVPLLNNYVVLSLFFLFILPFRIYRQGGEFVWIVNEEMVYTSWSAMIYFKD